MKNQFQSSPDPKAGRNVHTPDCGVVRVKFQSSPDPKAGRNGAIVNPLVEWNLNSICADRLFLGMNR